MLSKNLVILIGNLTADAELKALPSGTQVLKFGIATNWKTSKAEGVNFHDVEMYGNLEGLSAHMKKGKQVSLEGHLKKDTWATDDGEKRSRSKVVAYKLDLGSSPSGNPEMSAEGAETPQE